MVSHAYGAKKYRICSDLYYRSIFFNTLAMIPIFFIMFYSGSIVSALYKFNYVLLYNEEMKALLIRFKYTLEVIFLLFISMLTTYVQNVFWMDKTSISKW